MNEPIAGYRKLSQNHIDLINEVKELENKCGELFVKLNSNIGDDEEGLNPRHLALGRTNLQQGFMWMVRAIAKPESKL